MNKPLIFDVALGRTKPTNIRNEKIECPFCNTDSLTDILDTDGHMIWLKNKYPVLKDTWPTVIIETDDCHGEFSQYSPREAERVISFSMDKWIQTMTYKEFKSVLYFKNFGPMSGGSIRHPHSQIIGLKNYDYREDIMEEHFTGWDLYNDGELEITLSKQPLIGFFEYNLKFRPGVRRSSLSLRMQQIIKYLLDSMAKYSNSYNFFFYDLKNGYYYTKIVPRYTTTPLYIGYKIPQSGNDERAYKIKQELANYLI